MITDLRKCLGSTPPNSGTDRNLFSYVVALPCSWTVCLGSKKEGKKNKERKKGNQKKNSVFRYLVQYTQR